jgi:hypothetical protein
MNGQNEDFLKSYLSNILKKLSDLRKIAVAISYSPRLWLLRTFQKDLRKIQE